MPTGLKRFQQTGDLHFITFSCVRHRPILGTPEARDTFLRILEQTRFNYDFLIFAYVVMPTMKVGAELRRRHARAPIEAVAIEWWRKSGDEFRAAVDERSRSKVGRMARLKAGAKLESADSTLKPVIS